MKNLATRVTKVQSSDSRRKARRQESKVFPVSPNQRDASKALNGNSIVKTFGSQRSMPNLSDGTKQIFSGPASQMHINPFETKSHSTNPNCSDFQSNSLQQFNKKSAFGDTRKSKASTNRLNERNISTNGTNHDDLEKVVVSAQNSSLDFHGKVNGPHGSLLRYNSLKISSANRVKQEHDKKEERRRRRRHGGWWIFQCPCCSPACCLVVGILTALLLAALATLISVLMMNKINGSISTTATTTTTTSTTATSATTTTTTSVTTTTSSTSTSTSTSATTATSSTSTSSTSTSSTSTTSTSSTSTTATTSTATTSTTTSSTSSTSTTSTSSTSTTATTTTSTSSTSTTSTSSTSGPVLESTLTIFIIWVLHINLNRELIFTMMEQDLVVIIYLKSFRQPSVAHIRSRIGYTT
ncbi:unnamed protein product [Rotaria socialis]